MMYFVEKLPKEKKWKRKEKITDRAEWNNVTVPKWVLQITFLLILQEGN